MALLQRLLRGSRMGRHIHHEVECSSTNDLAKMLLRADAPPGMVVVAESQTAGRGRFQRPWTSEPGHNLLWTMAIRWPRDRTEAPWLTVIAALAVRAAVRSQCGVEAEVKWPNDVVVPEGALVHKLSGVLTEATNLPDGGLAAAVGVGLNVNQIWTAREQQPSRPRISLRMALGKWVEREPILAACLIEFEERLCTLLADGPRAALREMRESLAGVGRMAVVQIPGRHWEGRVEGVDDNCHLLLRGDGGQLQRIAAGEVLFGDED